MNVSLLIELTKRDFTERFSGSILGVGWSIIWPLVSIFIYTVIFSKIMAARLPGNGGAFSYGIYLVAGLVPWTAFSNTVLRSATIYLDKKHIISKINISLIRLPLFIVLSESITFLITMGFFFIFLLIIGASFTKLLIYLPFIYIAQQIFAFALGFFIAMFTVFIRDLKEVTGIVLQLWFWFTPIVYISSILPEVVKKLLIYNPAYLFIHGYQNIFVYQKPPELSSLIALVILGHLILLIAFLFYRILEKDIRDFV